MLRGSPPLLVSLLGYGQPLAVDHLSKTRISGSHSVSAHPFTRRCVVDRGREKLQLTQNHVTISTKAHVKTRLFFSASPALGV